VFRFFGVLLFLLLCVLVLLYLHAFRFGVLFVLRYALGIPQFVLFERVPFMSSVTYLIPTAAERRDEAKAAYAASLIASAEAAMRERVHAGRVAFALVIVGVAWFVVPVGVVMLASFGVITLGSFAFTTWVAALVSVVFYCGLAWLFWYMRFGHIQM
jgi:hypothetical protein